MHVKHYVCLGGDCVIIFSLLESQPPVGSIYRTLLDWGIITIKLLRMLPFLLLTLFTLVLTVLLELLVLAAVLKNLIGLLLLGHLLLRLILPLTRSILRFPIVRLAAELLKDFVVFRVFYFLFYYVIGVVDQSFIYFFFVIDDDIFGPTVGRPFHRIF